MRKLILLMHTSLDGFVATESGGLDWIRLDDELFGEIGQLTHKADAALYGRVTYDMMESYWPTAAEHPKATRHDKEHSAWYNNVLKYVISRGNPKTGNNAEVIGKNLRDEIEKIKSLPGKDILMIGSTQSAQALMQMGLIDEYWLCVYPVLLGAGIRLFPKLNNKMQLQLSSSKTYRSGAIRVVYSSH